MELTKSEMEIMDVLWGSEKPLSRADLLAHSEEKSWKDRTTKDESIQKEDGRKSL